MRYLPQEIIALKRDGYELSFQQIKQFIDDLVNGDVQDYQASALLMAIMLKGMSAKETSALTKSMMQSGRIIELPEISRPKVDKHSTGGVGDKVSLILSPLAAACGLCVPMMSGRGLGHTGGTLDKLEAIPGFSTQLSDKAYRQQLRNIHQAIMGQSEDIVPADRKLYALRDVTATVESIPLICASILSKKLAEGIDALVLDVKFGKGAFMLDEFSGYKLAETLVAISSEMGKPTSALLTRMDQPIGRMIGNSLEVIEAIECLRGNGSKDLMEITFALCAEMLILGGLHKTKVEAMEVLNAALCDGKALEAFRELVHSQGGEARVIDNISYLPRTAEHKNFNLDNKEKLYVSKLDAKGLGLAACLLGAGRVSADSCINHAVGLELLKKLGDCVEPGEAVVRIHYQDKELLTGVEERIKKAIKLSEEKPNVLPLIAGKISKTTLDK